MNKTLVRILTGFMPTKKMRQNFREIYEFSHNNSIDKESYDVDFTANKIILIKENGKECILTNKDKIKGLKLTIHGENNIIKIYEPYNFENCEIFINGENDCVNLNSTNIFYKNFYLFMIQNGHNRKLTIGKQFSCEGLTIYQHDNNSVLEIGNNCMFSHGCFIQCCDSHLIYDNNTHDILNMNENRVLSVGDNVWVAQGVTILKNSNIPSNSIIGCGSIVNNYFEEENIALAGAPAQIIKHNVKWSRFAPNYFYKKNDSKIKDNEITFVVQGAINSKYTEKCLQSIRSLFPLSFIILSTWENSDIKDLRYLCDEIILNKDPQGILFSNFRELPTFFNLDRQIVSTTAGLKKVKTKYAMKIRTDMVIYNKDFLNYFDIHNDFDDKYKLFKKRIVSFAGYSPYTKDKKRAWDFCMHDFAYFGLTQDLLKLWDIPLMNDEEKHYWEYKNFIYPEFNSSYAEFIHEFKEWKLNYKYHAEQYITIKAFSKIPNIKIKLENMFDFNDENVDLFKKILVNNFVPLYTYRLGISLPREENPYQTYYTSPLDYTYKEFLQLYNKYAKGNAIIPKEDNERELWNKTNTIKTTKNKTKLYKFLHFYWLRGKK